jgi:septal ring factor EnvC (AmiA/AmiB activator)
VGVLLLKKAKKVKVARQRGRVAPLLLRVGDRFRARSKVKRAAARAYYWRMGVKKFTLTKRSATLSPAEMATLLAGLGADVDRLDGALTTLAKYVQTGFAQQGADIAGLQSQLSGLTAALAALEERVAAIEAGLPALESRLQDQIDALASGLAALQTQVGTLQGLSGDVSALKAQMAAVQSGLTALQTSVTGLQGSLTAICGEAIITVC